MRENVMATVRFARDEENRIRLYRVWDNMRSRCYCPSKSGRTRSGRSGGSYDYYGGRGIKVCDSWKNSFPAFRDWAMSHGYADHLYLDRIDPDGNYCPQNCRFVTAAESARNKRGTIYLTFMGVKRPMAAWAEFLEIPYNRLLQRYHAGWTDEEILTAPYRKRRPKPEK